MRLKDIPPVNAAVDQVKLVELSADRWSIQFSLGGREQVVTRHWPGEEIRTWKSVGTALDQAAKIFDINEFTVVIHKEQ